MSKRLVIGTLLASALILAALAQSNSPAANPAANKVEPAATTATSGMWRASKLKGLNVYNDKNEKLGDINEILLDKSGKVDGVVIGVGGFLGMGEHDIKVEMSKLNFVNEPVRTPATTTATTTTGASNHPASTTTAANEYPDHAVLSGAPKDSLKAMPQFKFD